ncbi:MAG: GNAT family N-acetyltransferase [Myxococcales bacterium]|nr:GNAT family N-acetyltransferase [Myxococcales bacterium]
MRRLNLGSGLIWESEVGYSRLVKVGRQIAVAGTGAFDEQGRVVGAGDAYAQTVCCLERIDDALRQVGSGLSDVVRTRIYVIDIDRDRDAVARAHQEYLGQVLPVCSMLQVTRLIDPALLVELEVDAIEGAGRAVVSERPRIVEARWDTGSDLARMLESVDLPEPDVDDGVQMLKAYVGGELVGCVGYALHGESAVMHSLVVIREAKGEGVGRALVQGVIARASEAGVRRVLLATTDTTRYFSYLGFSPLEREEVPAALLESSELAAYDDPESTIMCYALGGRR